MWPRITALIIVVVLALGAMLTVWPGPADSAERSARRIALLVGVSDYDNLPPERDLLGPANDVQLFRDVLLERGFEDDDIIVLADGVAGAGQPTRRGILKAWQRITRDSRPGDFLFFYYAGHGSQQPADDDTEPDGLEEIILPKDIGRWDGTAKSVVNAITDNEVAAFLKGVTAAGANVWAVFDACHSATLTRSMTNSGERSRYLGPTDLGVPADLVAATRPGTAAPLEDLRAGGKDGTVTAFFASASSEPTPELKLPRGHPERRYHGLFSYSLARLLRTGDYPTYRELANGLLLDYAAQNRRAPTPHFDGSLQGIALAAPLATPVAWQARRDGDGNYEVFAGVMQGLNPKARLELLDSSGKTLDRQLEVSYADLLKSTAAVVGDATGLPDTGLVRVFEPAFDMSLAVCPPAEPELRDSVDNAVRASTQLRHGSVPDCDVRIVAEDGWLWLTDASTTLIDGKPPEKQVPRVEAGDDAALRSALEQVARARALMLAVSQTGSSLPGVTLDATLNIDSAETAKLLPGQPARLRSGDSIELALENGSADAVDVTILFIDTHYRIHALWPGPDMSNRVPPGGQATWSGTVDTRSTLGREQILVFANRAAPNTLPVDLSFLAQTSVATRGARRTPLTRFLYQSGFVGGATRGIPPVADSDIQVHVLTWVAD